MEKPLADDSSQDAAEGAKPSWNWQLDPACWAAAMDQSRAAEETARSSFPDGKPFPIPDRECDLAPDPPDPTPARPQNCYYAVNDRPVKLVPTPDGGLDVLALNMRTGRFERDMGYLTRCITCDGDVDVFPDEAAFLTRVEEIRTRLDGKPATAGHWVRVAAGIPVWWCVVVVHFLGIVSLAHWLGDATRIPDWLKPVDTFLVYQISNTVLIVFEILWLLVIAVAGAVTACIPWLLSRVVDRSISRAGSVGNGQALAGFTVAAKVMFLPIVISLITLAIMPLTSRSLAAEPSMLEAGATMSWAGFVAGVSQQSYMVFVALLLLLAFSGVISAMIRWLPDDDGFWQLPVAVLLALVAAIATGGLLFKLIYPVVEQARGAAVAWLLFACYSLVSVVTSVCAAGLRKAGTASRVTGNKA